MVKTEDILQGDSSCNGLQNMLFLVSSLAQVAKHQGAHKVRRSHL